MLLYLRLSPTLTKRHLKLRRKLGALLLAVFAIGSGTILEVGLWSGLRPIAEHATGLELAIAIFVLGVNGVLVPCFVLFAVATTVRDGFK